MEVPDTMTAADIDEMTRRLQSAVVREHGIVLSTVGVYSYNTTDDSAAQVRTDVTRMVMAHDGVLQMHGFYVNEEERTMTFDVVIDFDVDDRAALFGQICAEVQEAFPQYQVRPVLDRDLSD